MTRRFFNAHWDWFLVSLFAMAFSTWLMWKTFSYSGGYMIISEKAWSDFASHIPLIRSFSLGDNFPPQYPIFPGEQIRYHFLFYWLVGILEKGGIRIDFSLNILSSLALALLILSIYFLAKVTFTSRAVGFLSVLFFLFNGSFSFLEFFKKYPLSFQTITQITNNQFFPSFGPYDGSIVSAFWNLNIYTNQRHFALPLFILFASFMWFIYVNKKGRQLPWKFVVLLAIYIGLLPFAHSSIYLMCLVVFSTSLLFYSQNRMRLLTALLVGILMSLPRVLFLRESTGYAPQIVVGYLISDQFTFLYFIKYWFYNVGMVTFLAPIGFLLATRFQRKLLASFFPIFLIGNIIQFSVEMSGNHKFFNVFFIVANIFCAYVLVRLWKIHIVGRFAVVSLSVLLILSGVIDFFAIKNDRVYKIADYPNDSEILWIIKNTQKNSVFLNSSFLYHPASLAGRSVYLGWPYFAWSLGYDTNSRMEIVKKIYTAGNIHTICDLLESNNIDYLTVSDTTGDTNYPQLDINYFRNNFKPVWEDLERNRFIFETNSNCFF